MIKETIMRMFRDLPSESLLSLFEEPREFREAWEELASNDLLDVTCLCNLSFSCFNTLISFCEGSKIHMY